MSATEEKVVSITCVADSTLAVLTGVPGTTGAADPNYGKQYRFVKVAGEHTVGLASADEGPCIGVLQNKPQHTGDAATVAISGVTLVMAGGTITAGGKVSPKDTDGTAIAWVDPKHFAGTALTSGDAGELISVLLTA